MTPLLSRKGTVPLGHPEIIFRVLFLCSAVVLSASGTAGACPAVRQEPQLDVATKAHFAPLVFHGRLIRIARDQQSPVIRATFRIEKLYKQKKRMFLKEKMDVLVEFSTGSVPKRSPSECRGVTLDRNELRSPKRYIVFAAMRRNRAEDATEALIGVARPEAHAKKVLCKDCQPKAPTVDAIADVRVELRSRLRLKCHFSGNPLPKVSWFKNGVKVKQSEKIRVRSKKRSSRLVIRKASRSDGGDYECRASNMFGDASGVAKVQVTSAGDTHKRPNAQSNNGSTLWQFQGLPCRINSYCLNGGTCSLYEAVGEYVCICAEGYIGQRCQSKAISTLSSPTPIDAPQSPHDLDATTRMLQHYWGK